MGTPFAIGSAERQQLHRLRQLAELTPRTAAAIQIAIDNGGTSEELRAISDALSIELPFGYGVTFTIDEDPEHGRMRRLSVSSPTPGRVPLPQAMQMVMDELGFKTPFHQCIKSVEEFAPNRHAVNVLEKIE